MSICLHGTPLSKPCPECDALTASQAAAQKPSALSAERLAELETENAKLVRALEHANGCRKLAGNRATAAESALVTEEMA